MPVIGCNCADCQRERDARRPGGNFRSILTRALRNTANKYGKRKRFHFLSIKRWIEERKAQYIPGETFRRYLNHLFDSLISKRGERFDKMRTYVGKRLRIDVCPHCFGRAAICGCWQCSGCREWHTQDDHRCHHCFMCEHCCECVECPYCHERHSSDDLCEECGRCGNCCRCGDVPWREDEDRSGEFHGQPSDRYPFYLGVEIECAAPHRKGFGLLRQIVEKWDCGVHSDGSVNGVNACEIVTAPARGGKFTQQINDICRALEGCKAKVDSSCGLHIHVDVRSFTSRKILGLVHLYSKVEDALFEIVAPSRATESTYCKPWGDAFDRGEVFKRAPLKTREEKLDIVVYGSAEEARRVKRNPYKHSCRYHGLNLNAIAIHGTVEFRLHHGTVDERKITMWAALCSSIVNYAKAHPEREIGWLKGTPFEILTQVVGEDRELATWIESRREHFAARKAKREGRVVERRDVTPEERSEV